MTKKGDFFLLSVIWWSLMIGSDDINLMLTMNVVNITTIATNRLDFRSSAVF